MKLTVLGGSAAGGNSGMGCSGYLVQSESTNLVLDLGPGTLHELRLHCDFRDLDAIIITHWHVDHMLDLAALRYAVAYNPAPPQKRISLHMAPGTLAPLRRFGSSLCPDDDDPTFFDDYFDVYELDPEATLNIGDLTCRFHPTRHYVPCWAVAVTGPNDSGIGYSADTGPNVGLEAFFAGLPVVIAEAAALEHAPGDVMPCHLTAAEAGELATGSGAQTLILSHIWEEHDFEEQLSRASEAFRGTILVGAPGMSLHVPRH